MDVLFVVWGGGGGEVVEGEGEEGKGKDGWRSFVAYSYMDYLFLDLVSFFFYFFIAMSASLRPFFKSFLCNPVIFEPLRGEKALLWLLYFEVKTK